MNLGHAVTKRRAVPKKLSGRRGVAILRPLLVRGCMRYDVANAVLLNDFLLVSDCVVIPCDSV